jgi:hypothetical protein
MDKIRKPSNSVCYRQNPIGSIHHSPYFAYRVYLCATYDYENAIRSFNNIYRLETQCSERDSKLMCIIWRHVMFLRVK